MIVRYLFLLSLLIFANSCNNSSANSSANSSTNSSTKSKSKPPRIVYIADYTMNEEMISNVLVGTECTSHFPIVNSVRSHFSGEKNKETGLSNGSGIVKTTDTLFSATSLIYNFQWYAMSSTESKENIAILYLESEFELAKKEGYADTFIDKQLAFAKGIIVSLLDQKYDKYAYPSNRTGYYNYDRLIVIMPVPRVKSGMKISEDYYTLCDKLREQNTYSNLDFISTDRFVFEPKENLDRKDFREYLNAQILQRIKCDN